MPIALPFSHLWNDGARAKKNAQATKPELIRKTPILGPREPTSAKADAQAKTQPGVKVRKVMLTPIDSSSGSTVTVEPHAPPQTGVALTRSAEAGSAAKEADTASEASAPRATRSSLRVRMEPATQRQTPKTDFGSVMKKSGLAPAPEPVLPATPIATPTLPAVPIPAPATPVKIEPIAAPVVVQPVQPQPITLQPQPVLKR